MTEVFLGGTVGGTIGVIVGVTVGAVGVMVGVIGVKFGFTGVVDVVVFWPLFKVVCAGGAVWVLSIDS